MNSNKPFMIMRSNPLDNIYKVSVQDMNSYLIVEHYEDLSKDEANSLIDTLKAKYKDNYQYCEFYY